MQAWCKQCSSISCTPVATFLTCLISCFNKFLKSRSSSRSSSSLGSLGSDGGVQGPKNQTRAGCRSGQQLRTHSTQCTQPVLPAGGQPKHLNAKYALLQFLQRAVALFDTITPELFATDRPTHCFLLLGASTSRPREAYELLLPAAIPGMLPQVWHSDGAIGVAF